MGSKPANAAQADDEEETGSESQAKGRTRTRRSLRRKVTRGKKIITSYVVKVFSQKVRSEYN